MLKKYFVKNVENNDKYIMLYEKNTILGYIYKYQKIIILLSVLLLLLFFIFGGYKIYSMNISENPNIKYSENDISFSDIDDMVSISNGGSDALASSAFESSYEGYFKKNGLVLVKKIINNKKYKIIFFTDGSALRIYGDSYLRIAPLLNGDYGISENNVLDINAQTRNLNVINITSLYGGKVIYFDDGSCYSENTFGNIYIRNSKDVFDTYISYQKLSYKTNNKNFGSYNVCYFGDGTILITNNDKKYLVHNKDDILINDSGVSFPNNNSAYIVKSFKYLNDFSIDYFSDGSAIIYYGNNILSLRGSNSLVISNNNFIELLNSNMVDISSNIVTNNGDHVYYYNNGSAIIDYSDGSSVYVYDNSLIKYRNDKIFDIGTNYEKRISENNINNQFIKKFENILYIEMNGKKYIVNSNDVSYNSDGSIKSLDKSISMKNGFLNITNNTNNIMHFRVVLEEGDKTSLDSRFIKYMISVNGDNTSNYLNNNIWSIGSILDNKKRIEKTSYILYEGDVYAKSNVNVRVVFWVDYENITNNMMNTSFVGTMKIYSAMEEV